jgi:cytochrome c biogenesis protein CcmG/thiol:disulfide interchange protein DsbE
MSDQSTGAGAEAGDPGPQTRERRESTRIRWVIAAVGVVALAAVAVDYYMPWRKLNQPMPSASSAEGASASRVSCPVDAKPANLTFTMKDMNGQDVSLSKFKGKVILLDFWATWCEPCKAEIPWFIEFNKKYAAKGLQVIGISVDDTVDKLEPYVKNMKMDYLILQGLGHDDVQDAYGPILGIPVTVVISREGKICATHAGLAGKDVFENEIKALLQSGPAEGSQTN